MRTLIFTLSLVLVGGASISAGEAAAPPGAAAAQNTIADLEALQKRNAAAPDEPIYEYEIESRVNADPKIASLREQVAAFEVKYAKAQEKYAEGSQMLRKSLDELDLIRRHLTETQRAVREQLVSSTLARARENSALAGAKGVQAYAVDDLVAADPRVAEVLAQIAPIEMKYQQMRAIYVDGAPQLKSIQQKLDALAEKLDQVKAAVRKEVLANPRAAQGAGGGVGAIDATAAAAVPTMPLAEQPTLSREEMSLSAPLTLDLHAAHLQDITDQLSQALGLSFVIDSRVVAPKGGAAAPKPADKDATADAAKTGKKEGERVTDGMVAATNVAGKPLREALHAILDPMGLDYSVQPGFIWISTPQHVRHETFEILETRQYAVRPNVNPAAFNANSDLTAAGSGALDLVDVLRKAIPEVVSRENGEIVSRMNYDEAAHRLMAHTTPANHRKIQSMLEALNVIESAKTVAH